MSPTAWWILGFVAYSLVFRAMRGAVLSFRGIGIAIPWWIDLNYDLVDWAIMGSVLAILTLLLHT